MSGDVDFIEDAFDDFLNVFSFDLIDFIFRWLGVGATLNEFHVVKIVYDWIYYIFLEISYFSWGLFDYLYAH
jgi:hypothetical protein